MSEAFKIRNGVRQGGMISPILFCIYMDSLFARCRKSGVGCYLGNLFAAVYGYADDLLLASPSRGGLQKLLDIASSYAEEHSISFSTNPYPAKSKTKCMVLGEQKVKSTPVPLLLNGSQLPWVEFAKYLGCRWTSTLDGFVMDINMKK